MFNVTLDKLQASAVNGEHIEKLSNLGDIAIGTDLSDTVAASILQNNFKLVDWLMSTPVSTRLQTKYKNGSIEIHRDSQGKFLATLPYLFGTSVPTDTGDECCWVPFELEKCATQAPIHLLCLKSCAPVLERFLYADRNLQGNDFLTDFTQQGESLQEAQERIDKLSMAWYTSRNVILGTSTTSTPTLKPFHGLLEVLEGADVLHLAGANLLATFDSLGCRIGALDGGDNIIFALHPLVYEAVKLAVRPGQFGEMPAGWAMQGEEVTFKGCKFITDKVVPVDVTAGTGEIWMLDGDILGMFLATELIPGERYIKKEFATNGKQNDGCATDCTYYYNFGTVGAIDTNRLAVVTDVQLSANCLGGVLNGLDYVVEPNTIMPIKK